MGVPWATAGAYRVVQREGGRTVEGDELRGTNSGDRVDVVGWLGWVGWVAWYWYVAVVATATPSLWEPVEQGKMFLHVS